MDGCPDNDNDSDGVLDAVDGAPLDAEDRDGFQDEDGVPDPDNDGDGVLDADDGAPLEAEDRDGFEDEDGVPDPDNDGDGVLDADDGCPNAPGKADDEGCPATVRLDLESGRIVILERVEFARNSDVIETASEAVLEDVRIALSTTPEIQRVRVEGHTDGLGNENANLDLARRRAATVVRWLLDRGIPSQRLEAWGCGEWHPIETNDTAKGRRNNRRVEFHILAPAPAENPARERCVPTTTGAEDLRVDLLPVEERGARIATR